MKHTLFFPVPKMNVGTPKTDQKKKKRLNAKECQNAFWILFSKDKPREENRVSYVIREA